MDVQLGIRHPDKALQADLAIFKFIESRPPGCAIFTEAAATERNMSKARCIISVYC
jgi:hypothetical protein